jgi:putative ABC transport system substrate-binding protein
MPFGGMRPGRQVNRREAFFLLGGAAALAACPAIGRAQQSDRVRRIAVLMNNPQSDLEGQKRAAALRAGLQALGYIEGQNLQIDWRWSGAQAARAAAHAAEVVALAPEVIVANASPNLAALKQATQSIPIVFAIVNDPVGQGFIANMARPGGNITGFSLTEFSMFDKSLDLLKLVAPEATRIGFMFNPETSAHYHKFVATLQADAARYGVVVSEALVRNEAEINSAVQKLASAPGGGLIVPADAYTTVAHGLIINAAARLLLPAIYTFRQFVREGALMSYGPDSADIFRRVASYVDRILKGANVAELPAQTPEKFELAVNLKTASTLGLRVPETLLALADEVVE